MFLSIVTAACAFFFLFFVYEMFTSETHAGVELATSLAIVALTLTICGCVVLLDVWSW